MKILKQVLVRNPMESKKTFLWRPGNHYCSKKEWAHSFNQPYWLKKLNKLLLSMASVKTMESIRKCMDF